MIPRRFREIRKRTALNSELERTSWKSLHSITNDKTRSHPTTQQAKPSQSPIFWPNDKHHDSSRLGTVLRAQLGSLIDNSSGALVVRSGTRVINLAHFEAQDARMGIDKAFISCRCWEFWKTVNHLKSNSSGIIQDFEMDRPLLQMMHILYFFSCDNFLKAKKFVWASEIIVRAFSWFKFSVTCLLESTMLGKIRKTRMMNLTEIVEGKQHIFFLLTHAYLSSSVHQDLTVTRNKFSLPLSSTDVSILCTSAVYFQSWRQNECYET